VCRALDERLPEVARIATVPQLAELLTELAIDLVTSIVGSADCAGGIALIAQQQLRAPTSEEDDARPWSAWLTSPTSDSCTRTIRVWPPTTSSP
jgi:hypothetical protein